MQKLMDTCRELVFCFTSPASATLGSKNQKELFELLCGLSIYAVINVRLQGSCEHLLPFSVTHCQKSQL